MVSFLFFLTLLLRIFSFFDVYLFLPPFMCVPIFTYAILTEGLDEPL